MYAAVPEGIDRKNPPPFSMALSPTFGSSNLAIVVLKANSEVDHPTLRFEELGRNANYILKSNGYEFRGDGENGDARQ
jgi:hypothetical protein